MGEFQSIQTFGGWLDSLLPKRCAVCAKCADGGFCTDCQALLPWIAIACECCGAQLREAGVCGACQKRHPHFDRAIIPFKYRAPVSDKIQTLKYNRQLRHADALGAMICQRARYDAHPPPQVLIPVPLHAKRLRQRGFNQALEIARRVGAQLGIDIDYSTLTRVKNTRPQTGLGELMRRRNVSGAFHAASTNYAHIALIDDVVTSGSTVNAAARALKRAGVKSVSVWAAATT